MKNRSKYFKLLLFLAILMATLGIFSPIIPKVLWNKEQLSELALVGDWWGGTSAVFIAISGIILLILNFLSQREELDLTREELKLTRKEFKQQNETLIVQKFENTLFNLLSFLDEIVDSIEVNPVLLEMRNRTGYDEALIKGVNSFKVLGRELCGPHFSEIHNTNELELAYTKEVYRIFAEKFAFLLNQYFRYIKFTIKFVDSNEILTDERKQFYINILRYQISDPELTILFYMGISEYGTENEFKELFEKYRFFADITDSILFRPEHKVFYVHLVHND